MYIMLNTLLDDYKKNHLKDYRKRHNSFGCIKDLKPSTDNFNLLIEDSIEKLKFYNRKFDIILNIQFGEKLGKEGDNYYIFQNGYFQQMTRWWYSENRYKTYDYIEQDLDDFTKYLEKYYTDILLSEEFKIVNINHKGLFLKIANFNSELCEFIKKMVVGIYTLKRTYTYAIENSYGNQDCDKKAQEIVTLIDYKITRMLHFKQQFLQTFQ